MAGGGFALFVCQIDGFDRTWTRFGNLDSTGQFGSNGAVLFDVDGDAVRPIERVPRAVASWLDDLDDVPFRRNPEGGVIPRQSIWKWPVAFNC